MWITAIQFHLAEMHKRQNLVFNRVCTNFSHLDAFFCLVVLSKYRIESEWNINIHFLTAIQKNMWWYQSDFIFRNTDRQKLEYNRHRILNFNHSDANFALYCQNWIMRGISLFFVLWQFIKIPIRIQSDIKQITSKWLPCHLSIFS